MGKAKIQEQSHTGYQEANYLTITTASQSLYYWEAEVKSLCWESSPGTLMWNTGVLTARLNTHPAIFLYFLFHLFLERQKERN